MNYRKNYEEKLGVKLSKELHVHHIDFDRNNNDTSNLVALPAEVHQDYHKAIYEATPLLNNRQFNFMLSWHTCNYYYDMELQALRKISEILNECEKYILYKEYKLNDNPMYLQIYGKEELY